MTTMTLPNHLLELYHISTAFLFSWSVVFVPYATCMPAAPSPSETITIVVPNGTRIQGSNLQLLCTPSSWIDVAKFLLVNYAAHSATVKSLPGEVFLSTLKNMMLALFFPVSGVRRGVNAIFQRAVCYDTPLKKAARARALCMVIRAPDWKPEPGDIVEITDIFDAKETPRWRKDDNIPESRVKRIIRGVWQRIFKLYYIFVKTRYRLFLSGSLEEQEISHIPAYSVQPFHYSLANQVRDLTFNLSSSDWDISSRAVHGSCQLPPGYTLCVIPPGPYIVEISNDQQGRADQPDEDEAERTETRETETKHENVEKVNQGHHPSISQLSSSHNLAKGLVAVFQACYASFTLYQARGDQIQRYGYAAFGLTVTPYLIMSIVNLLSNVVTPDYPTMYLVESDIMEEAKKRGDCNFEGVVGKLLKERTPNKFCHKVQFDIDNDGKMTAVALENDPRSIKRPEEAEILSTKQRIDPWNAKVSFKPSRRPSRMISRGDGLPSETYMKETYSGSGKSYVIALIPLAVYGALSHFQPHQSNTSQRVLTMMWLVFGMLSNRVNKASLRSVIFIIAPAIGGFVVVSQMILQYGSCVKLT